MSKVIFVDKSTSMALTLILFLLLALTLLGKKLQFVKVSLMQKALLTDGRHLFLMLQNLQIGFNSETRLTYFSRRIKSSADELCCNS